MPNNSDLSNLSKHDVAHAVFRFLGIQPDPAWFSKGGTVTEDAWAALLPVLQRQAQHLKVPPPKKTTDLLLFAFKRKTGTKNRDRFI